MFVRGVPSLSGCSAGRASRGDESARQMLDAAHIL